MKTITASVAALLVGTAIMGIINWLAGDGILVSSLGGVTKNQFENRISNVENILNPDNRESIWQALEDLKPTDEEPNLNVSLATDDRGEPYAIFWEGQEEKLTLREDEIMLKSAYLTAETNLSKWGQMADGSLLYSVEINFDKPLFSDKPSVIVGFTGFQYSPEAINQAIRVEAMNPLPDGFKLHFSFKPGGYVREIHAHWLAYGPK